MTGERDQEEFSKSNLQIGQRVSFPNQYDPESPKLLGQIVGQFNPQIPLFRVRLALAIQIPHTGMTEPGFSRLTELNIWAKDMSEMPYLTRSEVMSAVEKALATDFPGYTVERALKELTEGGPITRSVLSSQLSLLASDLI